MEGDHRAALPARTSPHRDPVRAAHRRDGASPPPPPGPPEPFFFAYLRRFTFPVPAEAARGIAAITVPDTRWQRRDVKTTMLLPAVLAKKEAVGRGADEAIFVGQDGFVNEGASSTVFAVHDRASARPRPPSASCPA